MICRDYETVPVLADYFAPNIEKYIMIRGLTDYRCQYRQQYFAGCVARTSSSRSAPEKRSSLSTMASFACRHSKCRLPLLSLLVIHGAEDFSALCRTVRISNQPLCLAWLAQALSRPVSAAMWLP